MENLKKNEISFRNVTYQDIKKIVDIKKKYNFSKFEKWFSYIYEINKDEEILMLNLIKNNRLYLQSFNEEQLKASFIIPILFRVNFIFNDIRDWYEYSISAKINGVLLKGRPYFMIAKGDFFPEKPYFFIQEFKRSNTNSDPEIQLIAEIIVAMKINKRKKLHACYILGRNWFFVILEKLKSESYEYFVSESFDCLKIKELKQIYINLQAVKVLFCN